MRTRVTSGTRSHAVAVRCSSLPRCPPGTRSSSGAEPARPPDALALDEAEVGRGGGLFERTTRAARRVPEADREGKTAHAGVIDERASDSGGNVLAPDLVRTRQENAELVAPQGGGGGGGAGGRRRGPRAPAGGP